MKSIAQCARRRRAVVCLLCLGASGCGFGSAGVAAALGKDKRTVTRTPTQLTLLTPEAGQSGRVKLSVGLDVDANENLVVETVGYSLLGAQATFAPATPALGFPNELVAGQTVSGGTVAARASKFFAFVWNSHHDLDTQQTAGTVTRPVTARAVLQVAIRNTKTNETITKTTDEFYLDQSLVATVAGGGVGDGTAPATASMLDPVGVATFGSEVYVADSGNHRVRRLAMAGIAATTIDTVIGNGYQGVQAGTGAASRVSMNVPVAVTADGAGNLFVAESATTSGSILRAYQRQTALVFDLLAGFTTVSSLHMTGARRLYIAEQGANMVWRLDLANVDPFLDPPRFADLQPVGTFAEPLAVAAVDIAGTDTVYVVKRADRRVARIVGASAATDIAGNGALPPEAGRDARAVALSDPAALAATATHIFVADRDGNRVVVVDAATLVISNVLTTVRLANNTTRALRRPAGLALDAAGLLFIVETGGALTPGAVGHQVVVASQPLSPADAVITELAAGTSLKQVTQVVAGLQQSSANLVFERTTRTG
jgi:hypothetical protein